MGKRSRVVSSSLSGDDAASDLTRTSTELEDLRTPKLIAYDTPTMPQRKNVMQCSLPPHSTGLGFASLEDFEVHYAKEHTNRCVECGRNLPSIHFLNLHLDENHNPVREALAAKGEKTYACFVPDCDKTCSTPQKRRMHLIDKHNFPKAYNFRIINNGIDNASTLLQEGRRRRISVSNNQSSLNHQRTTSVSEVAKEDHPEANIDVPSSAISETRSARLEHEADQVGTVGSSSMKPLSTPGSGSINDLERSFAALHFVPRSVQSKQGKDHT